MRLTKIDHLQDVEKDELREALSQVQVIPKIESYLEDMNLEDSGRMLGVFSASEIGSRGGTSLCGQYIMGCGRMMYHRYMSDEPREQVTPRTRRIFDTGSKIHEQLQGYLHKMAKSTNGVELFWDEVRITPGAPGVSDVADELDIYSTTDGIWAVYTPDLELRFGVEIKSMKAELFKDLNKAHDENIVQAHVYMACLDLPAMTILYYNKNDSTMAEFCVPFDQDIWDAIKKKIEFIRDCAIDENPPPREVGFHCRYCKYSWICKPPRADKKSLRAAKRSFRL